MIAPRLGSLTRLGHRLAAGLRGSRSQRPLVANYSKIFVIGCPRSGTSWTTQMLSEHPRVVSTGESHVFFRLYQRVLDWGAANPRVRSQLLKRCQLEEANNADVGLHLYCDVEQLGKYVDDMQALLLQGRLGDDHQAAVYVVRRLLDGFFLGRARNAAQGVLVEKSPQHLFYVHIAAEAFPEAKFVQVLRDGRDVCVSLEMRSRQKSWAPAQRRQQILMWRKSARQGLQQMSDPRLTDRMITVRYEDMKADPSGQLARLYDFCDLEHTPRTIANIVRKTDIGRAKHKGPGQHLRKGQTGDWRHHFTAEDSELFRSVAGDVFEQCGYRF